MPPHQSSPQTPPPHPRPRPVSQARRRQSIGDIILTPDTVATPSGLSSTTHVQWQIEDARTAPQSAGPEDGAKASRGAVGAVRITATAPGWTHVTTVEVSTLDEITAIYAKVLGARRLARRG